jgi:hypothetical protein
MTAASEDETVDDTSRQDHGVLAAATAILAHLDQLVGPAAPSLRASIERLLAAGDSGDEVGTELRRLLSATPETAGYLRAVLTDPPRFRSPYEQERYTDDPSRHDASLLGSEPAPVAATTYRCPRCGWSWRRPSVGVPVPRCANDDTPLDRVAARDA